MKRHFGRNFAVSMFVLLLVFSCLALQVRADAGPLNWTIEDVARVGTVGDTSIFVDSAGTVHISCYNDTSDSLSYAKKTTGEWVVETVDTGSMVGIFNSIAVGSDGLPQIAYHIGGITTIRDLAYVKWNGAFWDKTLIDTNGNVGQFCDLALDSNNYPRISYANISGFHGTLKYARWNGATWFHDDVGEVGEQDYEVRYTSIAVDSSDHARISFYDEWYGDLMYANLAGDVVSVDTAGDVGQYCSIALASNGYPYISYYDATNGQLKLAKRTVAGWDKSVVDNDGDVGMYSSLALDANDNPHICYWDATNWDLKYAAWNGASWDMCTVDATGNTGQYCSLALDDEGIPHISYRYINNGRLKYATLHPESVPTATGSGTAELIAFAGQISGLTAIPEGSLPTEGKPEGVVFPDGLFSFTITDLTPGQTVLVTLHLPSNVPVGSLYWKYHAGVGWYSMPIGSDDGDNVISITLTDGGIGDSDGAANGVIADPGGPTFVVPEMAFGTTIISLFAAAVTYAGLKRFRPKPTRHAYG